YKQRVGALVEALGVRERCVFLGNRGDVETLYCACDLTVLPSLFEGTPNVVLESMACGVPVICTRVSDNEMLVPDGRAGRLVRLGDEAALAEHIVELLEDEPLRRRMSEAAREWVTCEFSTQTLARKTADVYDEFLRCARRAPATGIPAEA